MRPFPARVRCLSAILLICTGACGILLAPAVGLFGGREVHSFTLNEIREHAWGTSVTSSEFELPSIHNRRGLIFMNLFLAGSLGAVFGGVHWLSALRRGVRGN